jgi:pimeloyl-ACP methyl ester carboxylesterase
VAAFPQIGFDKSENAFAGSESPTLIIVRARLKAKSRFDRILTNALAIIACLALSSAPALGQSQAVARPLKTFKVQTPDGLFIAVQEWGNADGLEVLFIHGFSQSHLSWSRQFSGELAKSFRLITYDIRGHGTSDKPLDALFYRDHKRWAGELKAVMEATKLKKPVLVGWSYGGRIIAEYLMEYGDKNIGGIHFVGAFLKIDDQTRGPATSAVRKMASESLAENVENTIAFLKYCTAQPLPADELQTMLAYNMVVPAKIRGHLLNRPELYEDALRKITVPVLVSHGLEDRVALLAVARYTASVISHARTSFYAAVGHMPFWEDTPRFNRELAAFVSHSN